MHSGVCEPVIQHGDGGRPREPWIGAIEPERQTFWISPALPTTDTAGVRLRWEKRVEVVHARCAGLDISKKDAMVCVRVAGAGRRKTVETVTTWSSMTNQILALREHLIAQRITCAVMTATGAYWKPFYYLLKDAGFEVLPVNSRHMKNLPGRKTDVADANLLAQLGAHGLVRRSFGPPEPIRQLRDVTRTRTAITRGTLTRSTADGKAARRRRDQAVRGGLRHPRCVRMRCWSH
jgi:hypothetical protein